MSESTQDNKDNIKTNDQVTADETLIQGNLDAEVDLKSNSSDSSLLQDEIQMTLKEFNQKIKDNDRSIKRIEESMAALYDRLERTPDVMEGSETSTKKRLKKKEKKIDKKGKKEKKIDKKGKKEKKIDKKGKKQGKKMKRSENANSTKATTSTEKKKTRRTISKNNKGRIKNASKKK
jgi:uncharacterized coiled-coil protein SlyX